jgi:hypothetical protein
MRSWVIHASDRMQGAIRVPGDKSISHRSLLLGALADGITEVRGFLRSEDCLATLGALRALGVEIAEAADGRILIPHFYDRVVPPTPYERAAIARIPFDERAVKVDLGIAEFAGPPGVPYFEKLMFQPTLNITGIAGVS